MSIEKIQISGSEDPTDFRCDAEVVTHGEEHIAGNYSQLCFEYSNLDNITGQQKIRGTERDAQEPEVKKPDVSKPNEDRQEEVTALFEKGEEEKPKYASTKVTQV